MSTDELAAIYERRYRRFLRVAEAVVGDVELARDVVQDAFTRLVRSRGEYRGEGSLDGWVWRTVVNTASNARRDRPPPHAALEASPEPATSNGHRPDAGMRALLAALPERQRLVLFLRYYADLDYRSIAEVLAIQPGTVGATLNQAYAAIRRLLEEEVPR
jgi:RNA polymerase sigma-70 factor, ECF subfamily